MNSTSGPSNLVRHHQPLKSSPHNSAVDFDLSDDIQCGTFRLTFGSNFVSNMPDNEYHTLKCKFSNGKHEKKNGRKCIAEY